MYTKQERKYLFLIISIFIAACVETDMYLPAFPDMMKAFSISEGAIQNILTWNFVGICISGPFYGPISDSFGRKKPLILALGIFFFGSILTVLAQGFGLMMCGRVLQGLGSGGCFTLGTAVIFDAFKKDRSIQALNTVNTLIPILMAAAPLLGGYLNLTYGFRSNFIAIALFVLVSFFLSLFFFKESHPPQERIPLRIKELLKDFKKVFTSFDFWQLTLACSLLFAGYIAFISAIPILFMIEFGVSKETFPFFQVVPLFAWVAGGLSLNRALHKWGKKPVKKSGAFLCLIGGLGFALVSLMTPENPYLITGCMGFYAFGANWIFNLYFPESMDIFPSLKGITASLSTSARLFIAAFVVGLNSTLYNNTIYPLVAIISITLAAILPCLILYEKRRPKT